jgi:hypothetical protein
MSPGQCASPGAVELQLERARAVALRLAASRRSTGLAEWVAADPVWVWGGGPGAAVTVSDSCRPAVCAGEPVPLTATVKL